MADGVELNAGSGGAVIATDDITSVHYQINKLAFGALDSATLAASGSGAVNAGTQRVILATDDPAVALLTTIDGDTGTLAGAVSGTEMQVDVVAELPAGNNNIGDVDIASIAAGDNNIGNVDIASIAAGDNNIGNVDIVTFPTTVHSADYDSGAGTDTTLAFGIAVPASGGAAVITGDASNGLDVDVTRVTGTVTVDGSGVTQPVSHAALTELGAAINGSSQMDVNIAASAATVAVSNAGLTELAAAINASSQMDVNIAASGATVPVSHSALTELAAAIDTEVQVDVVGPLPAGTNAIGKLAANSGVDIGDVDVTSIAAGTNNIGNVGLIGRTSGGLTAFNSIDLDESEEEIKASAGQIFSISAFNHTAAPLYLRFYNATAANTTVGTTATALGPFTIPGNADSDGAGFVWNNQIGVAFGTAISAAVTTGIAANDTGAPAANAASVVVGYV